ncbi:MAG: MFS transporter [Candidatus Omnitrophota bacterium]
MKFLFRALRYRNYRLFFIGQGISLIGTWMQQIAMSWLVYRLTNSALLLGIVGFMGQLPAFLLMPLAGVIADRYNRHRILVVTQILAMIQALVLAVLVLADIVAIWHIIALSVILGVVNSFDMPIRQAFTVEMIGKKEDLGNAIALNSSMVNVARLLGPSIAGIIIAAFGEGPCFLLNAASYIAAIIALLAMNVTPRAIIPSDKHILQDLKEGFVYAFNFVPIRAVLILLGAASLLGAPYQLLMPVFVKDIFHKGPETLGFLMAAAGAGALTGAIYLARRKGVAGLHKIIAIASGIFGLGIIVFALSKVLWFSMAVIFAAGFALMVQMAASNTVLQTVVEEDKRGRIMSLFTMAFIGMAPFGSLLAGFLAGKIGAPSTLFFGGVCCIIATLIYSRKMRAA